MNVRNELEAQAVMNEKQAVAERLAEDKALTTQTIDELRAKVNSGMALSDMERRALADMERRQSSVQAELRKTEVQMQNLQSKGARVISEKRGCQGIMKACTTCDCTLLTKSCCETSSMIEKIGFFTAMCAGTLLCLCCLYVTCRMLICNKGFGKTRKTVIGGRATKGGGRGGTVSMIGSRMPSSMRSSRSSMRSSMRKGGGSMMGGPPSENMGEGPPPMGPRGTMMKGGSPMGPRGTMMKGGSPPRGPTKMKGRGPTMMKGKGKGKKGPKKGKGKKGGDPWGWGPGDPWGEDPWGWEDPWGKPPAPEEPPMIEHPVHGLVTEAQLQQIQLYEQAEELAQAQFEVEQAAV